MHREFNATAGKIKKMRELTRTRLGSNGRIIHKETSISTLGNKIQKLRNKLKLSKDIIFTKLNTPTKKSDKFSYDVAILGWWYGINYGSILTYYGLNRTIESMGYSVLMVHESLGYNDSRILWKNDIISMKFAQRKGYNYTSQMHYSELKNLNSKANIFIVGSDQIWNPKIRRVHDDLFLDFADSDKKRLSYATSFGSRNIQHFTQDFIDSHRQLLKKFDAISVREGYAAHIAMSVFDIQASVVLDPVFLLPMTHYQDIGEEAPQDIKTRIQRGYLAIFFLDPTPEKRETAKAVANKLGLERIVVIPNPDRGRTLAQSIFTENRFEIIDQDSPEIFLHIYDKADYVVTDSYHGTAFSIIFKKPFSSIYNKSRGIDRFKSLLHTLGYGETRRLNERESVRSISENHHVNFEINHNHAHTILSKEAKASIQWLAHALSKNCNPVTLEASAT